MLCSDHVVLLKATAQHDRRATAVLCCGLEKNGMVGARHGHGMTSVKQTRPHSVNQMGKTYSKSLAARHGRGKAWERHAICESACNILDLRFVTRSLCAVSEGLVHICWSRRVKNPVNASATLIQFRTNPIRFVVV